MENPNDESETQPTAPNEPRYQVPSGAARDRFFQALNEALADILARSELQDQNPLPHQLPNRSQGKESKSR